MKKFVKVHHAALLSISVVMVCLSFVWFDNAPAQTKVREGQVLFSATGHDHSGGVNGNADLTLDSLTVAGSVVATGTIYATGTITGGGFTTLGNATATYFIGDGSLLTGIAAGTGDFMANGSVPMTGAYTSGVHGTNGYDFTQNGYYTSTFFGKMFWDSSKLAFRAGRLTGGSIVWDDANVGYFSIAMGGTDPKASGQDSIAMSSGAIASGQSAIAMGNNAQATAARAIALGTYMSATADSAIAIGNSESGYPLVNNVAHSLAVGFKSNVPTLFVSTGNGAGTYGQVRIATSANTATLEVGGSITATDTIRTNTGFSVGTSPGIDFTNTVCCTWSDFTCSATGTVTFTKGIITAETCP